MYSEDDMNVFSDIPPEEVIPVQEEEKVFPEEEPQWEETVSEEEFPVEEKAPDIPKIFDEKLGALAEQFTARQEKLGEEVTKLGGLLRQYIKENVEYQSQVRGKMEKKLEAFEKRDSGEIFNEILREIAQIYVDYYQLFDNEELSDKARGNIDALFGQLEDILLDHGAKLFSTPVGSRRELPRMSKVARKIPTDDESKNGTVAVCRRKGIVRNERMVLQPEIVDIYVYDETLAETAKQEEVPQESEEKQSENDG